MFRNTPTAFIKKSLNLNSYIIDLKSVVKKPIVKKPIENDSLSKTLRRRIDNIFINENHLINENHPKYVDNYVNNMNNFNNVTKNIIVVRHGESIWNKDSKFTGWTNIPLTKNGKDEAIRIGLSLLKNKLMPNIIFSSVLERCVESSNIIKNILNDKQSFDIPIHTSWRLNEKHYGTLEGIPRQYIRNIYGDKFTSLMRKSFSIKPPIVKDYAVKDYELDKSYPVYRNCYFKKIENGESKENVLNRLLPYFENDILFTLSENKLPLIVTHKHTLRVLMKHFLKINEFDFEHYDIPDKSIIVLSFDSDNNYVNHSIINY
jgi:2,3-bisphosphoglycerate-dependent phosphoglycerate mutase